MTAKYLIDTRKWPPGAMIQLPAGMDIRDVQFLSDNRSEMIRLLDDPAWRESLKVAETPRKGCRQCGDEIERDGRCPVCQPTIEDIIEAARMSNRGRQT